MTTRVVVSWRGQSRTGVIAGAEYADGLPTGARFVPVTFDDSGETVPDVDTRIITPVTGTVTLHRVHFLESDIWEGDFPRDDTRTEVFDELTAVEAARLIYREGLTFEATGGQWAASPNGSRIVDYATGERVEESAHLSGFHPRVATAIMRAVDGLPVFPDVECDGCDLDPWVKAQHYGTCPLADKTAVIGGAA